MVLKKTNFWRAMQKKIKPTDLALDQERGSGYERSPRMRRASWMSLGMMVTRFA